MFDPTVLNQTGEVTQFCCCEFAACLRGKAAPELSFLSLLFDRDKLVYLNFVFTFLEFRYLSTVFQKRTINIPNKCTQTVMPAKCCYSPLYWLKEKSTHNREQGMMSTSPHISCLKYTGFSACLSLNMYPELTRKILARVEVLRYSMQYKTTYWLQNH